MKLWCLDSKEKIEWDILELKVNKCEYRPLCAGCEQLTDSEDEVEESYRSCNLWSSSFLYESTCCFSTPAMIHIDAKCKYMIEHRYDIECRYNKECDFKEE